MNFSIVIPALNEEKYIGNILTCLSNQTFKDFEVIVVDGSSTDKTKDVATSFSDKLRLSIIDAPRGNVSKSRNKGALSSYFDHIVFFDADVSIESTFLEKIAKEIEKSNPDILTSWNIPVSKKVSDKFMFWFHNAVILEGMKYFTPGAVGVFIYVRKDIFMKVGGFNEQITFGEDFDLTRRFSKAGYKYILLKDPKIYVSVRRLNKEGRLLFIWKMIRSIYYYIFVGLEKIQGRIKHESGNF